MRKKTIIIAASVTCAVIVAAGLGVLIWWLVTRGEEPFTVLELEGDGVGVLPYTAAFTRIPNVGNVFWWFYPTVATTPLTRPLVVWLDGVTGVPPSLLANLGMIGPYDTNLETRTDSWINQCNLLFIDAPLGTGYSIPLDNSKIPKTVDENVEHLLLVLESFYSVHEEYRHTPLYIFGQADGAKTAMALAIKLDEIKQAENENNNIQGIALGNGIISPAVAMTKLGFYLEELAYIDANGRSSIETLAQQTNTLVNSGNLEGAFDNFISLGNFVNEVAGAIAVNLGHIVEKFTREPSQSRDYFGQRSYMRNVFGSDGTDLMNRVVAPALGIDSDVNYDAHRDAVVEAVKSSFMTPYTDKIEYILQSTNLTVSIYNGNLDAVSNTPGGGKRYIGRNISACVQAAQNVGNASVTPVVLPMCTCGPDHLPSGQLEWVDKLQWSGQTEFRNSQRETLVVNRLIEGYFRETEKLKFFWINAAGQSAPLDNPYAMNRVLPMMTTSNE